MQIVRNEFNEVDGTLTIVSGRYEPVSVHINPKHFPLLRQHTWCFEQTKGQIYTTDMTLKLPSIFGFKSPRVYLWRLICYLETGDTHYQAPRHDLSNYRWPEAVGKTKLEILLSS